MGVMSKPSMLLILLIIIASTSQNSRITEARPLSLMSHQGQSKIFSTLGVVCKCCDGVEGDCTSTWTGSCSKLQCLPWKFQ
ncbi:Fibropellin-1 like [Quillaja saponaria]|uniref:Fibropellin-1 like n=1 Tax=Quillaja saponaria TaxID=32244 RepID=A0AAD7PN58_QUISA|nr:Fibropellin-1 like [Quillaja saponaria]